MIADSHLYSHRLPLNGSRQFSRRRNGNRVRSVRLLALMLALPLSALQAAEIYKWVDGHGRIQYGDQPPSIDVPALQMDTAPPPDANAGEKQESQQRLLEILTEERKEKAQNAEQTRKEEKQRQENCGRAQRNLQRLREAGFIYEPTSDPYNPRILTEAERGEITRSAEFDVKKWCR